MKYFLAICGLLFSLSVQASSIEVEGFELVKSERLNVREYIITYRLTIKNSYTESENLIVKISSSNPKIKVLDDEVEFEVMESETSIKSLDTFSVQIDRTIKFEPSSLVFDVSS